VGNIKVEATIGGKEIKDSDFQSFVVERDMNQPDMCAITASNQGASYNSVAVGAEIEVKVSDGDDMTSIYKGKVVGVEPNYSGGKKSTVTIRAMNKFHELLRKKNSKTFKDKTDQQIIQEVAGGSGLSLEFKHDDPPDAYKVVYQHNQTDLEFIRTRASRLGCHVWCVDSKLYVKQPDLQAGPIATLEMQESGESVSSVTVLSFQPRVGSSHIVKKITVKSWNPETKELITGTATAQNSKLGSSNASSASGNLGEEESFTVDHPVSSKKEADVVAKAQLQARMLSYMTGDARIKGDPKMDIGKIIEIKSNPDPSAETSQSDDPFNGKYYIMGLTHQYVKSSDSFTTTLRLARDAQKA